MKLNIPIGAIERMPKQAGGRSVITAMPVRRGPIILSEADEQKSFDAAYEEAMNSRDKHDALTSAPIRR